MRSLPAMSSRTKSMSDSEKPIVAKIIALKQRRRISLGPLITLVFENRETLQFQIQEMIRAERIIEPAKVEDELDVYNELLPAANELSATLLIEITEAGDDKRVA